MADGAKQTWRWTEDSPGAVVLVLLILVMALLFPHEACHGTSTPAVSNGSAARAEATAP